MRFWPNNKASVQTKRLYQSVAAFGIAIFLFISIFGLLVSTQDHGHDSMVGCPLMQHGSSLCSMGAVEHIAQWQQMFTATLVEALVMTILVVALAFSLYTQWRNGDHSSSRRYAVNKIRDPLIKLFQYLAHAFTNGIVHPKLYPVLLS